MKNKQKKIFFEKFFLNEEIMKIGFQQIIQ